MADRIFEGWLVKQLDEGRALAEASDLLELTPLGGPMPQHYLVHFRCKGLVQLDDGSICEAEGFTAGIRFPSNYLRHANPFETLTWMGPRNIWHPNISTEAPVICVGRITPGMGLVDLLYQVFEIITYTKVTTHDALNHGAAAWARENMERFPIDRRPLKRPMAHISGASHAPTA